MDTAFLVSFGITLLKWGRGLDYGTWFLEQGVHIEAGRIQAAWASTDGRNPDFWKQYHMLYQAGARDLFEQRNPEMFHMALEMFLQEQNKMNTLPRKNNVEFEFVFLADEGTKELVRHRMSNQATKDLGLELGIDYDNWSRIVILATMSLNILPDLDGVLGNEKTIFQSKSGWEAGNEITLSLKGKDESVFQLHGWITFAQ